MGAQRNLAEVFTEATNKLAAVAGLVSKLLVPGAGPASPFSGRHLLLLHGNLWWDLGSNTALCSQKVVAHRKG